MGRIVGILGLGAVQIIAFGASAVLAAVYLRHVRAAPSPLRSQAKAGSVAILGLIALGAGLPVALVAALFLSALGDWCLSRDGGGAFLAGMAAFGAAHVAYLVLFLNTGIVGQPPAPLLFAVAIGLAALGFLAFVLPGAGVFRWPVTVYAALIAAMVWAAILLPERHLLASLGAVVFMASDMMIALEKFRPDLPPRLRAGFGPAIWLTYWPAQALILLAFLAPLPNPFGLA